MKKMLLCFMVLVSLLSIATPSFAAPPDLIAKKRVAVGTFTIGQNRVLRGHESSEFANAATEKIINAFAALKRFTILDRSAANRLQLDLKNYSGGYKVGASKAADIYCTGSVQNVSVSEKYDSNGKFLGYDGDVELQLKIYDLTTGTLVLSKDVRGGTEIGGGLLSVIRFYQDTPSKAVFKSLNNAERRIKDAVEEAFPVEGKIVEVIETKAENETFLTTLGSNLGFKKGDTVLVIEMTQIKVNGVNYPRQKEIGSLEITKIEPDGNFSEARVLAKGGEVIIKKFESGYNLVLRSQKD
ncbi:MAG: hypothetical protein HGB06_11200 [Chlorobaculum sp.]|jgi:curli biogenesis system outer membrane secretion channel CsgG|nr:hypothetical protein [Chlorobaculum sp.]